jgi:hypothetical protein
MHVNRRSCCLTSRAEKRKDDNHQRDAAAGPMTLNDSILFCKNSMSGPSSFVGAFQHNDEDELAVGVIIADEFVHCPLVEENDTVDNIIRICCNS